jgi:hypothetical protein
MMDNTPNADYDARNRAACDLLTQAVRTMVPDADQRFVDDALEAMLETIYEEDTARRSRQPSSHVGYFAFALDDGDPAPLVILVKLHKHENGLWWGWGYSRLTPNGEYGTFPSEALGHLIPEEVFNDYLDAIRKGLLADLDGVLPRVRA